MEPKDQTGRVSYSGGCQCGGIVYEFNEHPSVLYACHCLDCQKQSSSAFGLSLWVDRQAFKVISGELAFWSTRGESGALKVCAFCPDCGSRIYHCVGDQSETLSLKGGTVNGIAAFKPAGHIWLKSAQPWLNLSSDQPFCYEKEPESFDELISEWQEQHWDLLRS